MDWNYSDAWIDRANHKVICSLMAWLDADKLIGLWKGTLHAGLSFDAIWPRKAQHRRRCRHDDCRFWRPKTIVASSPPIACGFIPNLLYFWHSIMEHSDDWYWSWVKKQTLLTADVLSSSSFVSPIFSSHRPSTIWRIRKFPVLFSWISSGSSVI